MTRAAILVDWTTRADEEFAAIEEYLAAFVPGLVITHRGHDLSAVPDLPVDLLVVDYGGIIGCYGSPALDWSRTLLRWADDHPGSLLLVWSSFTADHLGQLIADDLGIDLFELRWGDLEGEAFPWPANIRSLHTGSRGGLWGRSGMFDRGWSDETNELLARWFAAERPEEDPAAAA